jgi:HK97 family phage major capsid protein
MFDVEKLRAEIKAALLTAKGLADRADAENRDFTDAERTEITAKMTEATGLKQQLEKANADAKMRQTLAELGGDVELVDGPVKTAPNGRNARSRVKSLGDSFIGSREYKDLLGSVPGGHFTKDHKVQTRPVGYDRLLAERGSKALVTGASDTSAGAFVVSDYLGMQTGLEPFQRPLTLRNLVTNGTTTSDTVEYVRVASITNNAAPVAEATTLNDGVKPESGLTTGKMTANVKTIAHWIPVTKRSLSDAAQIRTLIDSFLEYGLEEELEDQMIAGDGTGENFTGLAATSGIQTQAYDTNLLTTLRKAKTKVRTVGRSIPTGYVINPVDVEGLDLLTDLEGRYYFGGPSGGAATNGGLTNPLWNLPVIESEATPAGVAYLGDWRKAILWDREQASITMSDQHASFFIQNLVAILAEMRAAFGIIQPSAFIQVDLTP